MQVVITLSIEEATSIIAEVMAKKKNLNRSEMRIVIGETDHIQNIQDATIKMRRDLIKRMEKMLPDSKISAIKELRTVSQVGLREAKDFVESPHKWEHYIKTGEIQ